MVRCPRCNFENAETNTYCYRCKFPLRSFTSKLAEYVPQAEYMTQLESSQSSQTIQLPQKASYMPPYLTFTYQKISVPRPRITGLRIFRAILYFLGVFTAALGLTSTIVEASSPDDLFVESIGIVLGLGLLIAGVLIFLLTRHPDPGLRWSQCILWTIVATVSFVVFIFLAVTTVANRQLVGLILSCDLLLYGLALVGIARKKATLHQRASESVRRMLMTVPGKQMPLAELVERLQGEFKRSAQKLYRYVGDLDFVEQIDLPGSGIKVCHIKGVQETLVFPQIQGIANEVLKEKIERALSFLNEENVDIGLFLLSKEFEATLKAYLVVARAKGKLSVTLGKDPDKWKLVNMVDCAKENGIINDHAVFHYLRQERNDRAHGTMPTLEERRALMKEMIQVAGLYIDYIKLLDELSNSL
jgi:hypothetical protein